jgi:hypothetical protein
MMHDPTSLDFIEAVWAAHPLAYVEQTQCEGLPLHPTLCWEYGTISLQRGLPREERATAALFMYLFLQGVDVGLARDLACSYFDRRIGRQDQLREPTN